MSQFSRVVKIANGQKWRTLRDIEKSIRITFSEHDTQPAISARLRDTFKLSKIGLFKETKTERINNKTVWFYRLAKLKPI